MSLLDDIMACQGIEQAISDRDCEAIAAAVSAGRTELHEYWLTDRGLVSDLVMATGNTVMSDSVLDKLDAAAAQSRSVKALTNRLYNDARGLNFGDPSLLGWFAAMTPSLFTADECSALSALAKRQVVITPRQVAEALYNDDGSMK